MQLTYVLTLEALLSIAQAMPGSPLEPRAATRTLPASKGSVATNAPIYIAKGKSFDGGMKKYDRSPRVCQNQKEGGEKETIFVLEDGAALSNVIIGPDQAEGVYCKGQCTLNNVWWQDVCEDAVSFKGDAKDSYINGGGAFKASDKIVQFNSKGTIHITDFYAEDYGKVARSCGTCAGQGGRHFVMKGVVGKKGGELCGVNTNMGDTCTIIDSCQMEGKSCTLWTSNGKNEPVKNASKPDGKSCKATNLKSSC